MRRPCFVIILLFLRALRAQEGSTCTLPNNGGQSKCMRLYHCDSFALIIRNSGGNPSRAEAENIRKHMCSGNLICCPDNAVKTQVAPAVNTAPLSISDSSEVPPLNDFNKLQSHKNINLINEKGCGTSSVDRIIGGIKASPGELPWMALLRFKSRVDNSLSFNCGGALISKYYVLTAAHCVNRELVAVRLGEHDLSTVEDCNSDGTCLDPVQDIEIEKGIRHIYDYRKKTNDIALLRLKTPADTSKMNVKTICLPTTEESQIDNVEKMFQKMLISGWGRIESGIQSDVLLKAFVPYIKNSECVQRFASTPVKIYSSFLCAGGQNISRTDTCKGDSGGPIQTSGLLNGKPKTILYGVVSVGVDCLNPNVFYPGIYTNVAHYLDWILDTMTP